MDQPWLDQAEHTYCYISLFPLGRECQDMTMVGFMYHAPSPFVAVVATLAHIQAITTSSCGARVLYTETTAASGAQSSLH